MVRHLLLAVVLLTTAARAADLPRATAESVGLSSERLARLERAMEALVAEDKLGGAVALVARRGKIAWIHAAGWQDVERGTPMTEDSLFRIWSMTKPITSVALLTLYEEGNFQLTDPAAMHVSAFADLKVLDHVDDNGEIVLVDQERPMTIQDLFRHTSGLSYGFSDSPVDQAYRDAGIAGFNPIPLDNLVTALGKAPLNFQPGTQWMYSYAHDVQAYLVEYFSGMAFDEFLARRLFEPLGMKDTSFGLAKAKMQRLTTVYEHEEESDAPLGFAPLKSGIKAREKPGEGTYLDHDRNPAGGTGLVSTVEDYFRFAQMLVNGGEFNGARILGRKTVELMTANHLPDGVGGLLQPGIGYGLGVSTMLDVPASGNLGSRGQFGWAGASSTYVLMDPEEELVAIWMSQYWPMNVPLWNQFQTLVYQSIID